MDIKVPLYVKNIRVGELPLDVAQSMMAGRASLYPVFAVREDGAIVLKEIAIELYDPPDISAEWQAANKAMGR